MTERRVKIGSASAFWGDTPEAFGQLLTVPDLDYLVGDYLAEVTMSLLARAKMKDPSKGYVPDFVEAVAPHLRVIAERNIKVVVNAGGLNPAGCREALHAAAESAGVSLRIATVEGDDLMPQADTIRATEPTEMFSADPFPAQPISMNAYLGATPIARALGMGAQVVITGRCNDAAMVLGPLMHEFDWPEDEYDRLAAGSLAGHLIECGPQCTGGAFTDWETVPGWDNMGFPVAECASDGSFVITKPAATGGMVTPATVGEQLLYEIGDPAAYILPDVVCDLTQVQLRQTGDDRVEVRGARGLPPTPHYKVSTTYADGYRVVGTLMIAGAEAGRKARRVAESILQRVRRLAAGRGFDDFAETSVEVIGDEDNFGALRQISSAREVVVKVAARHAQKAPLALLGREFIASATSSAQGVTGIFGGRPRPSPIIRLFSFLIDKSAVPIVIRMDGQIVPVTMAEGKPLELAHEAASRPTFEPSGDTVLVPLRKLALARSGDKGNKANIGIIARREQYLPLLRSALTPAMVKRSLSHFVHGEVERFELPGMHAFNFLLHDALGGGGIASLRYDPQGKSMGQIFLESPIAVPRAWMSDEDIGIEGGS